MSHSLNNMTDDEQQVWWYQRAILALKHFKMIDMKIEWLAYTHHAVFELQDKNNKKFILKLALPENSEQLQSEFDLLSSLSSSGLGVSQAINRFQHTDFSAILLSYLEGASRDADSITNHDMNAIGQFLASFHTVDYEVLDQHKRLDWDGLFTDEGLYHLGADITIFTNEQRDIMTSVGEQVRQAMVTLGQEKTQFGLIHGDLLLKNILFNDNKIYALDFEYASLGYYLYDLTPVLWQLKPHQQFESLQQALLDGYHSIRLIDAEQLNLLETFIAGRQVASLRWIVANQHNPYIVGKLDDMLTQRTAELASFLKTAYLKRH